MRPETEDSRRRYPFRNSIRLKINLSARRSDKLSATIRADDPYAKVSGFFTLPKLWTEGISGKWLNIRNLIGCGTPLASFVDEAHEAVMYSQHEHGGQLKSILDPS